MSRVCALKRKRYWPQFYSFFPKFETLKSLSLIPVPNLNIIPWGPEIDPNANPTWHQFLWSAELYSCSFCFSPISVPESFYSTPNPTLSSLTANATCTRICFQQTVALTLHNLNLSLQKNLLPDYRTLEHYYFPFKTSLYPVCCLRYSLYLLCNMC